MKETKTEAPIKEKAPKVKKEKTLPLSQISVVADGDFLVIRLPKKMAIKNLLN